MKRNEQLLLEQLEKSQKELEVVLDHVGACFHDAGICCCQLRYLIEDNAALIGRLK